MERRGEGLGFGGDLVRGAADGLGHGAELFGREAEGRVLEGQVDAAAGAVGDPVTLTAGEQAVAAFFGSGAAGQVEAPWVRVVD